MSIIFPMAEPDWPIEDMVRAWFVAADKQAAFRPIYHFCFLRARRFAFRNGCESDADDLAQDIMLRIFRGLHRLREPSKFMGWFYRIANYALADWIRLRVPRVLPEDETPVNLPDPRPDPEDQAIAVELREKIKEGLKQLTRQERRCLELFLEGYTGPEISDMLKLSPSTVKVHLHNARKKLRRQLGHDYLNGSRGFEESL